MDKNTLVAVSDSYYLSVQAGQSADSSSRSPSPNRSLKGFNLFRVISKKLGKGIRKAKEDKMTSSDDDEDSNSSTNSVTRSNNQNQTSKDNIKRECVYIYKFRKQDVIAGEEMFDKEKARLQEYGQKCLKFSTGCRHHHSSGSDTYSSNDDSSESNDNDQKTQRSYFSSNESSSSGGSYKQSTNAAARKGLKNLNLKSKSLSCFSISQIKDINERRDSNSKEKRIKKSPPKILRQPPVHTYVRGISGLPTLKVINTRGCYNNQYSRG